MYKGLYNEKEVVRDSNLRKCRKKLQQWLLTNGYGYDDNVKIINTKTKKTLTP